jgi:hypothetical protein
MLETHFARVQRRERVEPAEAKEDEEQHEAGHDRCARRQPAVWRASVRRGPRFGQYERSDGRDENKGDSDEPRERETVVAENDVGDHRPDREPAVRAHRDETHRLAASLAGREIGRHRERGDEETRLAEARDDPDRDDDR